MTCECWQFTYVKLHTRRFCRLLLWKVDCEQIKARGGGYLDTATSCRADSFLGRLNSTSSFSLSLLEPSTQRVRSNRESAAHVKSSSPLQPFTVKMKPAQVFLCANDAVALHIVARESKCLKRSSPPHPPSPPTLYQEWVRDVFSLCLRPRPRKVNGLLMMCLQLSSW